MEESSNLSKNIGILSTLSAATEIKFTLLSTIFILVVDNSFLSLQEPGIYKLLNNPQLIQSSNLPIKLILIYIVFSLLTSIILPTLSYFIDEIYFELISPWIDKLIHREVEFTRPYNYVTPTELEEAAHLNKDKFLLDLHNNYEKKIIKHNTLIETISSYSFYLLVILYYNYFHYSGGITKYFFSYLGDYNYIWFAILALLILTFFRFHIYKRELIYCPYLYKEINPPIGLGMPTKPFPTNSSQM